MHRLRPRVGKENPLVISKKIGLIHLNPIKIPSTNGQSIATLDAFNFTFINLLASGTETIITKTIMFQHTGRHIKRRPTCRPEIEGGMPLLFE